MSELRVIIAGGGTGGHIFPAVAIARALLRLRPDTKLLFVGAKGRMEMEKIPEEGFEIVGLDIAGFNRSNILKNISLPFKLLKTRMQSGGIIKEFRPHAIVGVGGYASFPVLFAGQSMNIPTLIQEGNSYAGKSNKILARRANSICVGYKGMEQFFPKEKVLLTGNPVRKNIADMKKTREEGRQWFGLGEGGKVVLIIGGSLGARSINESIAQGLEEILKEDVQLIWQTGRPVYEQARELGMAHSSRVKVFDFISDMDAAYAAADVVISRAGALASAELCIVGKPVIFVPYPHAAEDHQTSNARALVDHHAAMMVADADAKHQLVNKLKTLLHDETLQEKMAENIKRLAVRDADERIAKKVLEIAKEV